MPGAEVAGPVEGRDESTVYFRLRLFLSGVLDSFSIALFCFPFSVIAHALSSMCCRFLAEE